MTRPVASVCRVEMPQDRRSRSTASSAQLVWSSQHRLPNIYMASASSTVIDACRATRASLCMHPSRHVSMPLWLLQLDVDFGDLRSAVADVVDHDHAERVASGQHAESSRHAASLAGASTVWGELRQQIFLTRRTQRTRRKDFYRITADSTKSPRLRISASPREIPRPPHSP